MARLPVPIAQMQRRLPTAGRLRAGVRTEKAMKAIDTWRATSHDEEAIRQIARAYGGDPRPWAGSDSQWEVTTTAAELAVVLAPDPLGGTPIYERWAKGGCERRCDGVTCQVRVKGPDGTESIDVPCRCVEEGELSCEVRIRLSVILPDVRFGGVWRYESGSEIVAREMPGMVDLVSQLQAGSGLVRAVLALECRRRTTDNKPFTIGVLRLVDSPDAIASGAAALGALPPAVVEREVPALEAASVVADPDDEVVDAVVVEPDGEPQVQVSPEELLALAQRARVNLNRLLRMARAVAGHVGVEPPSQVSEITDPRLCAAVAESLMATLGEEAF